MRRHRQSLWEAMLHGLLSEVGRDGEQRWIAESGAAMRIVGDAKMAGGGMGQLAMNSRLQ